MQLARTILLAALVLGIAVSASVAFNLGPAFDDEFGSRLLSHREPGPDPTILELKRLSSDLNLSPDQQQKIRPILVDVRLKTREILRDRGASASDRLERISKIRSEANRQIWEMLTAEQKRKAIELQRRPPNPMLRKADRDSYA